jgi:hypothetical protein
MTSLFFDACMDGRVALSSSQAKEVPYNRLPSTDRDDARGSSSARYYRILRPRVGLLVVADYVPPTSEGKTKLCMITLNGKIDLAIQMEVVGPRLFGKSVPVDRRADCYQFIITDQRAMITLWPNNMSVKFLSQKAFESPLAKLRAPFCTIYAIH